LRVILILEEKLARRNPMPNIILTVYSVGGPKQHMQEKKETK